MDVYEVSLELEPLRGSPPFGDCEGLFVCVYLGAASIRLALDAAEAWAEASCYKVLDIDYCLRINLDEYEPHDSDYPTANELSDCLKSNVTGVFNTYETLLEH